MNNPAVQGLQVDEVLDVRGLSAAEGFQKAREQLAAMPEDQLLELICDEGEVLRRLPYGLRADGHEILVSEPASPGVRLILRKRLLIDSNEE
jgi:TusA-related sulfurtransferase